MDLTVFLSYAIWINLVAGYFFWLDCHFGRKSGEADRVFLVLGVLGGILGLVLHRAPVPSLVKLRKPRA